LKVLGSDKNAFFKASRQADKAFQLMMGKVSSDSE